MNGTNRVITGAALIAVGVVVGVYISNNQMGIPTITPTAEAAWGAAMSEEPPRPMGGPDIEARAERELRAMGEWLSAARAFTFHADITYDSPTANGQMIQYGGVADIWVQRPGFLHVEFHGDEAHRQVICDGSKFVVSGLATDLYAVTEVPAEIGAAIDLVFDEYGFSVPIADFVYPDPYAVLIESVESGLYVGRHEVDGTPCHHLAFSQESIDWQIWIEDGPRPAPRKLLITYKDTPGSPQYTARLSGWNTQPDVAKHWFTFEPPAGAIQIEFLPVEQSEVTP